jgi:hypothetical protein
VKLLGQPPEVLLKGLAYFDGTRTMIRVPTPFGVPGRSVGVIDMFASVDEHEPPELHEVGPTLDERLVDHDSGDHRAASALWGASWEAEAAV